MSRKRAILKCKSFAFHLISGREIVLLPVFGDRLGPGALQIRGGGL